MKTSNVILGLMGLFLLYDQFGTLEMDALARMDAARKEGYAQGEALAQKRMSSLIAKLSQEGRLSDLGSVADDPDALEALMVENGL